MQLELLKEILTELNKKRKPEIADIRQVQNLQDKIDRLVPPSTMDEYIERSNKL